MRPHSLELAISFVLASCAVAIAAPAPTPLAAFTVGTTHVEKFGSGEPALILIPGLTNSSAVWNGTIAHFAPTHTIYALTLAGFGGLPPAASPAIDKAGADVAALIAREHLNKPVVIGHSLGGFTAIRVAEAHSDLLRGAIAVDGLPVFPGMDAMTAQQRAAAATQMSAPFSHLTAAGMMDAEKHYSLPYMTKAANIDAVASASEGADPAATAAYLQEMVSSDIRPQLSNISVPFLEIGPFDATLDPQNPQSPSATLAAKQTYYQKLVSADPNAKVHMIDDSRHFIMFDQPQAFYAAVEAFLKSLP